MKFNLFIGIDVSKSTLDVYLLPIGCHKVFSNDEQGFIAMIEWIMDKAGKLPHSELLFGFEHTGLYSENLILFLDSKDFSFAVIPGLELKRSLGIRRGKSDKADSRDIAEYVYEKREKIKLYKLPSETLEKLKKLSSLRERMVKERAAYKTRLGEYRSQFSDDGFEVYIQSQQEIIKCFDVQIERVEKHIEKLIIEDTELSRQYKLINSIKGVGPQTAIVMIILTKGFSSFENWRKFASYAGIAPFPNQSGTFNGRTKTSKLANKRIKSLLTMCAGSAIQHNPEMKQYYENRIQKGKNSMSTLNIIRNKLLARVFAVITRDTPYVDIYKYAA
ncbi:IS110 family transposase [Aquiflexum sp.]|uniref:IS110 family transposase n=1 Tax=Aquiflexum sp. TaxID=1872584 RepID=UPI0035946288